MIALDHPGSCLTHRTYHLTCEDFGVLIDDHGAVCALCGILGPDTDHGVLCIDHDGYTGPWAVRGLLCSPCNTRIDASGYRRTPEEDAYVANPWYRRRFAALGLSFMPEPEPEIGTIVAIRKQRVQYWRRSETGWQRASGRSRICTWRELNRDYGPHCIDVASDVMLSMRYGRLVVGRAS